MGQNSAAKLSINRFENSDKSLNFVLSSVAVFCFFVSFLSRNRLALALFLFVLFRERFIN